MTGILSAAGTAVSPYLFWIKLAGVVVVVAAIAAGGWYGRGVFDQPQIDAAQLATQKCLTASEVARANSNAKAATGLQNTVNLASQADAQANADLGQVKLNSVHIMEKVDAQPNGISLGGNPVLRAYLDGLRGQAAAGN